jgi:hypothetical protein
VDLFGQQPALESFLGVSATPAPLFGAPALRRLAVPLLVLGARWWWSGNERRQRRWRQHRFDICAVVRKDGQSVRAIGTTTAVSAARDDDKMKNESGAFLRPTSRSKGFAFARTISRRRQSLE